MIDRRRFLGLAGAGLASAALARTGWAAGKPANRPNVLFIAVDDLNDWIGPLGGHPDVKTPNLDRLAKRSMTFERAYCAAPVCGPSRVALLTGRQPASTGVYGNKQHVFRLSEVLKDVVTLPEHFKRHGYRTAGGGKIFHGRVPREDPRAWDEPIKIHGNPKPDEIPACGIPEIKPIDWAGVDAEHEKFFDWDLATQCRDFLMKRREKPFFLACGVFRPHLPWYAPKRYFEMYDLDKVTLPVVKQDDLDDVPAQGKRLANTKTHRAILEHRKWREAVRAYLACVSYADACVGRVLDGLDRGPHRDNTIIVLWGDHGWHLAEKLHWKKCTLWEEATRTPLFVSAPGVTRAGSRCTRPVSLIDLYPTLIDLCGLNKKDDLDGESMMPLLKNPEAPWDRPALTTYHRKNHSLRSERYRYIVYRDGAEELYDHEKDPHEWENLANKPRYFEVKAAMRKHLPAIDAPDAPVER